jgi:hypothetical protein
LISDQFLFDSRSECETFYLSNLNLNFFFFFWLMGLFVTELGLESPLLVMLEKIGGLGREIGVDGAD